MELFHGVALLVVQIHSWSGLLNQHRRPAAVVISYPPDAPSCLVWCASGLLVYQPAESLSWFTSMALRMHADGVTAGRALDPSEQVSCFANPCCVTVFYGPNSMRASRERALS